MDRQWCSCDLCVDDVPSGLRSGSRIPADVAADGWNVTWVFDEEVPGWAYSVGLWHTFHVPEVVVVGLPGEVAGRLVQGVCRQVRSGARLEQGQGVDDVIEGFEVVLREVDQAWQPHLVGQALGFYRRPTVPLLQAVWPDREGRYPWEVDTPALVQAQLWLAPARHPTGIWTRLAAGELD